jgi:regulator of cell morphogenesis and NO signaling
METLVIAEPKKVPTVGEMAAADVRKANVFKKFGIEFCCGGNKSLPKACTDLNLDLGLVEEALVNAVSENKDYSFDFKKWEPDFLIDYIYNQHHTYFYDEYPVISKLMEKVANHHGKNHPGLLKAQQLFSTLERELIGHFAEEENTVFPLIKTLYHAKKNDFPVSAENIKQLTVALHEMQVEHQDAGEILSQIRVATNSYNPPASACMSFQLLYYKLKCLEEDLHQHIHLENNVLFPKAVALKKELEKLNLLQ